MSYTAREDAAHDVKHPACTYNTHHASQQDRQEPRPQTACMCWCAPEPRCHFNRACQDNKQGAAQHSSTAVLTQGFNVTLVAVPPDVAHRQHVLAACTNNAWRTLQAGQLLAIAAYVSPGRLLMQIRWFAPQQDHRRSDRLSCWGEEQAPTQVGSIRVSSPAGLAQPCPIALQQRSACKQQRCCFERQTQQIGAPASCRMLHIVRLQRSLQKNHPAL